MNKKKNPFRAAGTFTGLPYVYREADKELIDAIIDNQRYPYCLAPRQSGKSSLLINTIKKLGEDFHSIFIDLSTASTYALKDFDQFLYFIARKSFTSLEIKTEITSFYELTEIIESLINSTNKRIIIFLDEIDTLLLSNFKEQFFAQVRSIFNERSRNSNFEKVQFVLAGVAQPSDLISSKNISPFNVGIEIGLEKLTSIQVIRLVNNLELESEKENILIGERIYYFTNGSVYLTQFILEKLWEESNKNEFKEITVRQINEIVRQIIAEADTNLHFLNIYNQLSNNNELLKEFNLFNKGKELDFSTLNALKMIGITDGTKPFRNLIYELVFDSNGKLALSLNNSKVSFINVPFKSKGREFIGRKGKIEEIWNSLNKRSNSSIEKGISISGFGGLGKTQLAVEYAHAYKNKYPNGVYWLVADENLDNQLLQIGEIKGWLNNLDKTVNQLEVAKAKFLSLSECLILFDNVESYADIKHYLPKIGLKTHILITSRYKQHSFQETYLELLDRNESQELLLKIANRLPKGKPEKKQLEMILEFLDGIPLAIELVGGYLAEHLTVTFAEYHQLLSKIPLDQLEKEFPEGSFTHHDRSIIQTLRISEKSIKDTPLMVEILKVLAWSGNSSMGTSLLQTLVEAENDFEFETALSDACKLRLLKKDEDAERYAIHRLLAKVIRHEKPLEKQKKWHQKTVKNLVNWFSERENRYENLAEFESEIEHLEAWQKQTFKSLPTESIILTQLRGNIPRQRGNYQTAFDWFQKAFDLFESEKLDNKALSADLLNDLGSIYGELGNHQEALKYKEKALELKKELLGEKHPSTVTSYNNVGSTYNALGNHQEALKYLEKALELRKELLGEKHPLMATSYNNVGGTYGELGNHQEALKYKEKALELTKELFGEKHPDTATFYNNVGSTYEELGNHQEALKYLEKALELTKELLGEKHPDTATSYNNMGLTYGELGNHQEALKYLEKALELTKELFGEKHPLTASSYNNVGGIYGDLGNHEEALKYQEKALVIHQEVLGKQHPKTIVIVRNLIDTYLKLGYIDRAGKKAAEFFGYVPQNNPNWKRFEEISRPYRPKKNRHKKHGRR